MTNLAKRRDEEGVIFLWGLFEKVFLFLVFYIPFQVALNPIPEVGLASLRVLIPGLFLFWLVVSLIQRKPIFISDFYGLGLIIICVISVLSLFFAQELLWGVRKVLFFLTIFPIFYMTRGFVVDQSALKKIIKTLIISALVVSFLGLIQFLSQFLFGQEALVEFYSKKIGPVFWGGSFSSLVSQFPSWFVNVGGRTIFRAIALFPDPHIMSFFLGLILPIVFSLFLFEKKKPLWLLVICSLLFVALCLTFSRGGYLGILSAVFVVLVLSWRFLSQKKKWLMLAGIILAVLFIILFGQPAWSRFVSSFISLDSSVLGRIEIWQNSLRISLEHPWLGIGLGNYPLEVDPLVLLRNPINSHNLYLDILTETGIFGLAAWLFLILGGFCWLWRPLKKIKTPASNGFLLAVRIGLVGSFVYFLVHSFFETAIFNPSILALLMVVLGLGSLFIPHEHFA